MSLRILGGEFKGRRLKVPKSSLIRPTSSLVRKSLFDICSYQINQGRFLDVFAGSGSIGIEALSRGASQAIFIEKQKYFAKIIQDNLSLLQITDKSRLLVGDALYFLKRFLQKVEAFHCIYLDPPYQSSLDKYLAVIDSGNLLAANGLFFVETDKKELSYQFQKLKLKDCRKFGSTYLYQFELP